MPERRTAQGFEEKGLEEISTSRLEAFSDGVFAIAITLLILEIKVPHLEGDEALLPVFAEAVAIVWGVRAELRGDRDLLGEPPFLYALAAPNRSRVQHAERCFLMFVSFIPFPTAVLAEYLQKPQSGNALSLYALGLLLPSAAWYFCWWYARHNGRLIDKRLTPEFVAFQTKQYLFSNLFYLGAFLVSFVNATAALVIIVVLALVYLLPQRPPEYRSEAETDKLKG